MSALGERAGDRLRTPGLVLGLGLGGFVDGILLHHLLEWHHMLSNWYPMTPERNERINMIGDGMFHIGWSACSLVSLLAVGVIAFSRVRPEEWMSWSCRGDGSALGAAGTHRDAGHQAAVGSPPR